MPDQNPIDLDLRATVTLLETALLLAAQLNATRAETDNAGRRDDSKAELSRRLNYLRHLCQRAAVQVDSVYWHKRGFTDPTSSGAPPPAICSL